MVVIITWCLDSIYSIYIKMSKSVAQRFAEFRLRKGKLTVVKKLAEKNRIAEIRIRQKEGKVDEDKQEEYRRKERNNNRMSKKEANLKESIE